MTPPEKIGTGPNPDSPDARASAVRALQAVRADSLPATVTDILQITCRGLPAHRAAFWRQDSGNGALRLFCQASQKGLNQVRSAARLRVNGMLAEWLGGHDVHCRPRQAVADMFQPDPRTQTVLVLPVRLFDAPLGLLCVELLAPCDRVETGDETFLQLVAAKIETAWLAESPGSQDRNPEHYALRQSHLALSDDSLRDLFYLAPTAMLLTDLDEARPVAANRHALELFNISTERTDNVMSAEFWEDAADRQQFVKQAVAEGHVREYRARLRRADGKTFWGLVSATLIDHNGRPALMSSIADVSDTIAAEEVLNRTQNTLMTLLEASPYPLIVTRLDTGVIRFCNQKAADMFETPLSGLLGHTAPEFYVNPADRIAFVEKLHKVGKVEGFVAKLKTPTGQPFWAMLSAMTLELNGEPVFLVSFADVTRQKHKEEELENLAFKDGLTNAYNRRYFVEAARVELGRAERNRQPPAVALIDLDHFKQINDSFGHEIGDNVLREFVALVEGMLRKTDILARYGGEEFVILFPETEADIAKGIVDRIRATVAAHRFPTGATASSVTFSAGIAVAAPNEEPASLISRADVSLYDAKHAGRNRVISG
ncbi:MAG TPA: sensor domain-containing diguanylate cyclase [Gammaproteobacteria bacterium]